VSGLASLGPEFPMYLWCRLIHQCTQTLNLMRPSRINPRLSAEAQLNGAFDYNKTPLAPPGTKVLIHEMPNKRRTWAAHGMDGWYLGGAPKHYRCYRVYATKTRAERIAQTVAFFPHYGKIPQLSSADAAIRAAIDLCWAIRNPASASPLSPLGDDQMQAIQQLADIFATTTLPTRAPATPPRVPSTKTLHRHLPTPTSATEPPAPPRVRFTPLPGTFSHGPHVIAPDNDTQALPPLCPLRRSPHPILRGPTLYHLMLPHMLHSTTTPPTLPPPFIPRLTQTRSSMPPLAKQ
jgi:hypothetical protein